MKAWTFRISLLPIAALFLSAGWGAVAADERCVLRFNRDEVNVVGGELRVDLSRRVRRECRGLDARDIRLDQVTVELRDDRRGRSDDRRDYGRRGRDTIEVYRFFDGRRHLISSDPDEGERFGNNEGVIFELYRDGGRNRRPIYRCLAGRGDHFLSTDQGCEGHTTEGQLGFLAQSPDGRDDQPVYRCYNGKRGDHIATKDQNECASAGYAVESTLGYSR